MPIRDEPAVAAANRPLADWLKVLAEPNRLRILDLLMQGEQCNCEMGDKLGMAPNLISHHLGVLQRVGLVNARRDPDDARWVHYSMNPVTLAALNGALRAFFDPARMQPSAVTCQTRLSFNAPPRATTPLAPAGWPL